MGKILLGKKVGVEPWMEAIPFVAEEDDEGNTADGGHGVAQGCNDCQGQQVGHSSTLQSLEKPKKILPNNYISSGLSVCLFKFKKINCWIQ